MGLDDMKFSLCNSSLLYLLGLNVIEVAHYLVPKIKNWLLQQNIQNSFDTWHGKKLIILISKFILHIDQVFIMSGTKNKTWSFMEFQCN